MSKLTFIAAVAAIASGIAVVVMIFYVVNPDRIPSSPIKMTIAVEGSTENLCPGDILTWDTTMEILKPTTVQGFITIVNISDRRTVFSQPLGLPAINHYKPSSITRTAKVAIPDLPPGEYERILSMTALGYDGAPAFSVIPFSIRGDCEPTG